MSEHVLQVEVLTPDGPVYAGPAVTVKMPGVEGSFAVQYNHAPFISPLAAGEVKITDGAAEVKRFVINGGVAEVLHNHVIILVEQVS